MNKTSKKQNIFNIFFITLIFIGISLSTITGIFALTNFFTTTTKHKVNVRNDFANLIVIEASKQDESVNKFLIPTAFPNLNSNDDTHTVIKTFVGKLDNNGKPITEKMYLKTILRYDTNNNPTFDSTLACQLFNSRILINGKVYDDANLTKIDANKDYIITVETQQNDFLPNTVKDPNLFLVIEYELVDSQGKPFTGTQDIIKTQVVAPNAPIRNI